MKILADINIPYIKDYFSGAGELVLKAGRSMTPRDVKDADILLVRSVTLVNKDLLCNSCVRWVGSVTTGSDHLDTQWLNQASQEPLIDQAISGAIKKELESYCLLNNSKKISFLSRS